MFLNSKTCYSYSIYLQFFNLFYYMYILQSSSKMFFFPSGVLDLFMNKILYAMINQPVSTMSEIHPLIFPSFRQCFLFNILDWVFSEIQC